MKQRDGKLSYLKNKMEREPTQNNVYALVDEIKDRRQIEKVFHSVFSGSFEKELTGGELVTKPRDFKCMRAVHGYIDTHCDGLMANEYALAFNKYVIDFCETTAKEEQAAVEAKVERVCSEAGLAASIP